MFLLLGAVPFLLAWLAGLFLVHSIFFADLVFCSSGSLHRFSNFCSILPGPESFLPAWLAGLFWGRALIGRVVVGSLTRGTLY